MAAKHTILGVHVYDRVQQVPTVQQVFTEYGCYIKTRLGLHEASEGVCSADGLIVLELVGDPAKHRELAKKLGTMKGIEVKEMTFGEK
jgi:hypothetical protein